MFCKTSLYKDLFVLRNYLCVQFAGFTQSPDLFMYKSFAIISFMNFALKLQSELKFEPHYVSIRTSSYGNAFHHGQHPQLTINQSIRPPFLYPAHTMQPVSCNFPLPEIDRFIHSSIHPFIQSSIHRFKLKIVNSLQKYAQVQSICMQNYTFVTIEFSQWLFSMLFNVHFTYTYTHTLKHLYIYI